MLVYKKYSGQYVAMVVPERDFVCHILPTHSGLLILAHVTSARGIVVAANLVSIALQLLIS